MKELEELEEYFQSNGVKDEELILCGNYIKIYVRELCFEHSINITKKELNKSCKYLCRSLLDLIVTYEETANLNIKKQLRDVINDFESVDEKAIGNLLPILNNAKNFEETNTRIITELYSIFLPEDFDLSEAPDFMGSK